MRNDYNIHKKYFGLSGYIRMLEDIDFSSLDSELNLELKLKLYWDVRGGLVDEEENISSLILQIISFEGR